MKRAKRKVRTWRWVQFFIKVFTMPFWRFFCRRMTSTATILRLKSTSNITPATFPTAVARKGRGNDNYISANLIVYVSVYRCNFITCESYIT
jgi:hypothetical protein